MSIIMRCKPFYPRELDLAALSHARAYVTESTHVDFRRHNTSRSSTSSSLADVEVFGLFQLNFEL